MCEVYQIVSDNPIFGLSLSAKSNDDNDNIGFMTISFLRNVEFNSPVGFRSVKKRKVSKEALFYC